MRKAYVVLDGTLISIDRVGMRTKAHRPYYSGKHKRHGLNVQVLTDPAGRLIWGSPALPGSVHDLKAARRHGLIHALIGYDVPVLPTVAAKAPAAPSASHSAAGTCPPAQPRSTLLAGAGGDDRLTGGLGADRFSGGQGNDRATDYTAVEGDTTDGTIP